MQQFKEFEVNQNALLWESSSVTKKVDVGVFRNTCLYDIIPIHLAHGNVEVCCNPSCENKEPEERQLSNNISRLLQKDPLGITSYNEHFVNHPVLKKCSDCSLIQYCSKDCQMNDWKRHKAYCKATKKHTATNNMD